MKKLIALNKALTEYYGDDYLNPGVVVSLLSNNVWYASIARIIAPNTRKIVCKATGKSPNEALTFLIDLWLEETSNGKAYANLLELAQ